MKIIKSSKNRISFWLKVTIEHEGENYDLLYKVESGLIMNNPATSKLSYFNLPAEVKSANWETIKAYLIPKYKLKEVPYIPIYEPKNKKR